MSRGERKKTQAEIKFAIEMNCKTLYFILSDIKADDWSVGLEKFVFAYGCYKTEFMALL